MRPRQKRVSVEEVPRVRRRVCTFIQYTISSGVLVWSVWQAYLVYVCWDNNFEQRENTLDKAYVQYRRTVFEGGCESTTDSGTPYSSKRTWLPQGNQGAVLAALRHVTYGGPTNHG